MSFNHYAKIKRILATQPEGWYIKKINEPTSAKTFKGEIRQFDHYYRIYDLNNKPIKYCKFQQLDLFAKTIDTDINNLTIIE